MLSGSTSQETQGWCWSEQICLLYALSVGLSDLVIGGGKQGETLERLIGLALGEILYVLMSTELTDTYHLCVLTEVYLIGDLEVKLPRLHSSNATTHYTYHAPFKFTPYLLLH